MNLLSSVVAFGKGRMAVEPALPPIRHLTDGTEWIVDNEMSHPKLVPANATPLQLVFLSNDSQPGQIEVELQEGLNRLSYF